MQILLVEDNQSECMNFAQCIEVQPKLNLVEATGSSFRALEILKNKSIEAIILDLELDEGDGISFLSQVYHMQIKRPPYIVVTTRTTHPMTLECARECGAGYIFTKNTKGYGAHMVIEHLLIMSKYITTEDLFSSQNNAAPPLPQYSEDLYKTIVADLAKIGITPNLKASSYLAQAILMIVNSDNQNKPRIVKDIYESIGRKYKEDVRNIEKAIRSALDTAWKKTKTAILDEYYPSPVDSDKGKPTSKVFIYTFAERYR